MRNKTIKSLYISYNAITEPIVQSQVMPYLRELSKRNIRFYLLTFEKKKLKKEETRQIRQNLKNESSIEWFSLRYHKNPTVPATLFDIIAGCLYSFYIVIKNNVSVVHARAIVAALAGFPAAKLLGKKFIFDTRGIDSEEYVDGGLWKRGGIKHKAVAFLEKAVTTFSDHVVVLTEKFKDIVEERYPHKKSNLSVIPCAVDTERFKPGREAEDRFIIVYAGSLGTWYMLGEMLDFFKVVSKEVRNARFLLLTHTDSVYTSEVIKQKEIDASLITVDSAPYEQIPERLSSCRAGIFFIKPVFSKLSSSPVKFAEYLAAGLPVIINRGIGDTEETVRKNRVGVVVENFDEGGYAKAVGELKNLLEDKSLPSRCREVAERELSLKNAVRKYACIYEV